jgi:hypothetical protein
MDGGGERLFNWGSLRALFLTIILCGVPSVFLPKLRHGIRR